MNDRMKMRWRVKPKDELLTVETKETGYWPYDYRKDGELKKNVKPSHGHIVTLWLYDGPPPNSLVILSQKIVYEHNMMIANTDEQKVTETRLHVYKYLAPALRALERTMNLPESSLFVGFHKGETHE